MLSKNIYINEVKNNSSFMLFLISQLASYFADAFYFIAITTLLIKTTGSGASASFIVVCTPISSLLLSPFAGSLGDKLNEKYFLIFISLLKSLVLLVFLLNYNILIIYIVMLSVASLEIINNPPTKKIIAKLLNNHHIIIGNSILTGITGLAFIVGPITCGIIIELWGINSIFIVISLLHFSSAIILFFIKSKKYTISKKVKLNNNIYKDIKNGIQYFKYRPSIKKVIFINTVTSLFIASVNAAFYSFAFDILKVNSSTWGIMMSLFYGTNLVSMFVSIYFNKLIQKMDLLFVYAALIVICNVWFCYSFANNLYVVLILQFMEGLLLTLTTIFLNTKLQLITQREFIGRIVSINDILNNIGKLFSVSATYFILQFYSTKFVFILNCILLSFSTIIIMSMDFKNKNRLFL